MTATYNGWTNYETWCVNLWMDNDKPQYDYWADEARSAYRRSAADGVFSQAELAAIRLADRIKEEHENAANDMLEAAKFDVGPFADLLRASLSSVNWDEIARHWIESHCDEEVA